MGFSNVGYSEVAGREINIVVLDVSKLARKVTPEKWL